MVSKSPIISLLLLIYDWGIDSLVWVASLGKFYVVLAVLIDYVSWIFRTSKLGDSPTCYEIAESTTDNEKFSIDWSSPVFPAHERIHWLPLWLWEYPVKENVEAAKNPEHPYVPVADAYITQNNVDNLNNERENMRHHKPNLILDSRCHGHKNGSNDTPPAHHCYIVETDTHLTDDASSLLEAVWIWSTWCQVWQQACIAEQLATPLSCVAEHVDWTIHVDGNQNEWYRPNNKEHAPPLQTFLVETWICWLAPVGNQIVLSTNGH